MLVVDRADGARHVRLDERISGVDGAVTAVVLMEKIVSFGVRTVRVTGILLIALGLWVVLT